MPYPYRGKRNFTRQTGVSGGSRVRRKRQSDRFYARGQATYHQSSPERDNKKQTWFLSCLGLFGKQKKGFTAKLVREVVRSDPLMKSAFDRLRRLIEKKLGMGTRIQHRQPSQQTLDDVNEPGQEGTSRAAAAATAATSTSPVAENVTNVSVPEATENINFDEKITTVEKETLTEESECEDILEESDEVEEEECMSDESSCLSDFYTQEDLSQEQEDEGEPAAKPRVRFLQKRRSMRYKPYH